MTKKLLILAPLFVAGVTFLAARPGLPGGQVSADEVVATISHGEDVDLETYLQPGQWTLFEFVAEWCPVCSRLEPQLETIARENAAVRLRRIDIGDWNSPVARAHDIRRLPTLVLYDGERQVSRDTSRILQLLGKP